MKRAVQPVLAVLLVMSLTLSMPGASPLAQTRQEAPAIRATSRLVQVSVIVRDKKGAPVTDLKAGDFVLLDNGQPQTISAFSLEVVRGDAPAAPAKPLPPNTFANRERGAAAPVSVTVILFDALNTLANDHTYGKNQVVRFLSELQPQDRVALYALGSNGIRVLHDFSADPAPLVAALARYRAREERYQSNVNTGPEPSDSPMALFETQFNSILKTQANFYVRDRVIRTLDALIAIANHLSAIPGRKNLVWVSGSFPISFGFDRLGASEMGGPGAAEAAFAATSASLAGGGAQPGKGGAPAPASGPFAQSMGPNPDLMKPVEQGLFFKELERAARALNQAGMAIYPVDARGLVANPPMAPLSASAVAKNQSPTMNQWAGVDRQTIDSMNLLAERTGGRAFYNTNDIQGSVRRAIDDGRATYELAFYPTHNKWDGRFHEISVQVKRQGVDKRHRRGYYAVEDQPAGSSAGALAAAADIPFEWSTLGVTARMEPAAAPATWTVRLELNPREISLQNQEGRWVGTLGVVLVQKKADGSTASSVAESVDLRLESKTYERLLREGMRLSKTVKLEPDAYELRIVIRDAGSGATGSVHVPLSRLVGGAS